jgi:DNA primase
MAKAESEKAKSGKVLFVCEGPTDTAAALDLGLFAVGRPNCCCGGPEIKIFARHHAVARVVLISDNDKPGLDGARKVGGELKLPFAVYVPPAKDVREFVRLGGTRAMIECTLNNTVWTNPETLKPEMLK